MAIDKTMLEMALVGFRAEAEKIQKHVRRIEALLGGKGTTTMGNIEEEKPKRRRVLSPAARRRIAMAQKARWAAFRKGKTATQPKAQTAPEVTVSNAKRTMSKAAKANVLENLA